MFKITLIFKILILKLNLNLKLTVSLPPENVILQ